MRRWVKRHVGRRGAFLAFLAILDLAYGYSLLATTGPQRLVNLLLPWQVWGWIWIAVGVVCLSGVPVRVDRVQFAVAATVKAAWGLLYVHVWLIQGLPRGWVSVVVWLTFAFTVVVVSGWPEPTRLGEPPVLPRWLR